MLMSTRVRAPLLGAFACAALSTASDTELPLVGAPTAKVKAPLTGCVSADTAFHATT